VPPAPHEYSKGLANTTRLRTETVLRYPEEKGYAHTKLPEFKSTKNPAAYAAGF
jgi:hypothetical protein